MGASGGWVPAVGVWLVCRPSEDNGGPTVELRLGEVRSGGVVLPGATNGLREVFLIAV